MRAAGLGSAVLTLAVATATAGEAITEDAWGAALQAGCPAVRLQTLPTLQGCGPSGCGTWVGPLFVGAEGAGLRRRHGAQLQLADGPLAAADQPELNWRPLRGFNVLMGRRTWGQCLEFSHAGVGNSGHAQRWRSVLLVAVGARSAQRVIGYQVACTAVCLGPTAGRVQLPAVQPVAAGQPALQIVWTRCGAAGCDDRIDQRAVEGDAASDSGVLTIRP
jgi:hypothetical protein